MVEFVDPSVCDDSENSLLVTGEEISPGTYRVDVLLRDAGRPLETMGRNKRIVGGSGLSDFAPNLSGILGLAEELAKRHHVELVAVDITPDVLARLRRMKAIFDEMRDGVRTGEAAPKRVTVTVGG